MSEKTMGWRTPTEDAIGEFIWNTSRRDEGTISATGALIIARGLLREFRPPWIPPTQDEILRALADLNVYHLTKKRRVATLADEARVISDLFGNADSKEKIWDEGASAAFRDEAHGNDDSFWETNPYRLIPEEVVPEETPSLEKHAAQVLREAADAMPMDCSDPHHMADWLRNYAASMVTDHG